MTPNRLIRLLLAGTVLAGFGAGAQAQDASAPAVIAQIPSAAPLASAELAELRGGFLVAGGIQLDFGAVVRTYVDGQLALESRLQWTDQGAVTSQSLGSVPGAVDLAGAMDQALKAGLDIQALGSGQGVLLADGSGATALIQNIGRDGIQNVIVNNADGRNLRQEVEINLALPQLDALQAGSIRDRLSAQMSSDLAAASLLGR
ncbi:hypothetical protein [Brevundimonas sp. PAMC22021]|uniref:hypothetical protein n=1 Tax=Brevundimonas sp. PAMC22021 TaxID=2861285 RepID=UPI001C62BC36|nr:hypothetical protein [Brevundimonas sp. PAMC22021]QYF86852.1 hypothetical protein KY493_13765 [Brevundimonas sp. PAMC22021]